MLIRRLYIWKFHQKNILPLCTSMAECPHCFASMLLHHASSCGACRCVPDCAASRQSRMVCDRRMEHQMSQRKHVVHTPVPLFLARAPASSLTLPLPPAFNVGSIARITTNVRVQHVHTTLTEGVRGDGGILAPLNGGTRAGHARPLPKPAQLACVLVSLSSCAIASFSRCCNPRAAAEWICVRTAHLTVKKQFALDWPVRGEFFFTALTVSHGTVFECVCMYMCVYIYICIYIYIYM